MRFSKNKFLLPLLFFLIAFLFFNLTASEKTQLDTTSHPPAASLTPEPVVFEGQVSGERVEKELVKVVRVVDGDTIEIDGGIKVRYIGIDTPETVHPQKGLECFGKEAASENRKLVAGKMVRLEKDVSETDRYGRLLRYVFLPQDTEGFFDLLVNDYLVRQGYAQASTYPPDVFYQEELQNAQEEAKNNNRGLWAACFGSNQDKTIIENDQCPIKGNISSSAEKIYHLPGQRYYNQTVVDKTRGERWFCSESEARDAGWRKAKI